MNYCWVVTLFFKGTFYYTYVQIYPDLDHSKKLTGSKLDQNPSSDIFWGKIKPIGLVSV